jgi:hypothetical protein
LLLVEATFLLILVSVVLRLVSIQSCIALFKCGSGKRSRRKVEDPWHQAERTAALVERANRRFLPLPANCLSRSLALYWVLSRRGIPAELRLGVRTITGRFEAHAWVEIDGVALGEADDVSRIYEGFDLV